MAKEILPGVFAKTETTHTYAVSSEHLYNTGEFQVKTSGSEGHPLDETPELVAYKDGPRMSAALGDMREGVKEFEHLKDTNFEAYEQKVSALAIEVRAKHFGEYDKTKDVEEERTAKMVNGERQVNVEDIGFDGMVCRHMAPVTSILMHEVGVSTHVMISDVLFDVQGIKETEENVGHHAYLVSDKTGNVVETTTSAKRSGNAYKEVENMHGPDVWERMVDGEMAVIGDGDVYGTGSTDGLHNEKQTFQKAMIALADARPYRAVDNHTLTQDGVHHDDMQHESATHAVPAGGSTVLDGLKSDLARIKTEEEEQKKQQQGTEPIIEEEQKKKSAGENKTTGNTGDNKEESGDQDAEGDKKHGKSPSLADTLFNEMGIVGMFLAVIIEIVNGGKDGGIIHNLFDREPSKDTKDRVEGLPAEAKEQILEAANKEIEAQGIEGGLKGFVEKAKAGELSNEQMSSVLNAAADVAKEHGAVVTTPDLEKGLDNHELNAELSGALAGLAGILDKGSVGHEQKVASSETGISSGSQLER